MSATLQILMSCYNEKPHIADRMRQVLSQTRQADGIVIVDDGSTDGSLEMLEQIAREYPLIDLYSNGTNQGGIFTVKRLMSLASADYLHFASFDDVMLPEFVEKNMAILEAHAMAAIAYSPAGALDDETGTSTFSPLHWATRATYFTGAEFAEFANGHPLGGLPTVVKRKLLEEIGGFPEELKWHSDGFIETMLALRHGFCFIPEMLTIARIRQNSYSMAGMRNWETEGPVLDRLLHQLKSPEFKNELPLYEQAKSFFFYGPRTLWTVLGNPAHWDIESFRLIRPMLLATLQHDQLMDQFILGGLRIAMANDLAIGTASQGTRVASQSGR